MHISIACGHRGSNPHPCGASNGLGTTPLMGIRRSFFVVASDGMEFINPLVYGCLGLWNMLRTAALSTIFPRYMMTTSSAMLAMTPRSCVMNKIAALNSVRRSFIRPNTCAWIVTSRAVVGSSAIRGRGCRRGPWRSLHAGASHRKAGAGTGRCAVQGTASPRHAASRWPCSGPPSCAGAGGV